MTSLRGDQETGLRSYKVSHLELLSLSLSFFTHEPNHFHQYLGPLAQIAYWYWVWDSMKWGP